MPKRSSPSNREIIQKILEKLFPELEPSLVFKSFKAMKYDAEKTIENLCSEHKLNLDKKRQAFNKKMEEQQITLSKTDPSQSAETPTSQNRLRSAADVMNRIKWDKKYNLDQFIVGYLDRFEGLQEVPFSVFDNRDVSKDSFIPFHRVQYFKQNDEIMWSKVDKIDKIFGNEEPQQVLNQQQEEDMNQE